MKTRICSIAAFLLLFFSALNAQQEASRFGLELNGGASFATQPLNGHELNPGFGFEALLHYRVLPHLGAMAGWGWNRLATDATPTQSAYDYEETGYILGLQFMHPFGESRSSYFLRAAALLNHIEVEGAEGQLIADTGHGWGWQAAAGISLPLGRHWALMPGVKFNVLDREVDWFRQNKELELRYFSARVGILKKF